MSRLTVKSTSTGRPDRRNRCFTNDFYIFITFLQDLFKCRPPHKITAMKLGYRYCQLLMRTWMRRFIYIFGIEARGKAFRVPGGIIADLKDAEFDSERRRNSKRPESYARRSRRSSFEIERHLGFDTIDESESASTHPIRSVAERGGRAVSFTRPEFAEVDTTGICC